MFKNIFTEIKKRLKIGIEWLKPKAATAIKTVNALKKAVESPITSFIVNLTATNLDDKLLALAQKYIAKAAEVMMMAEGIIEGGSSEVVIMDTLIAYLQSKGKEARVKWWRELQAKVTVYLADGKIDEMEAISLGQILYKELHAPASAA